MPRLIYKSLMPALLLLFLSCGDDADSASGFAAAYCDLIKPCCAMAKLRTDGQQCRFFFGAFGGESSYNRQAGEACLSETRGATGMPDCQRIDSGEPSACDDVFGSTGKKQPGEDCDNDTDCAPSTEGSVLCQISFGVGTQFRKCQVVVKGKDGDKPCVGTRDGNSTFSNIGMDDIPAKGYLCHVADGLRCNTTSDTCVKLKVIGEVCAGDDECVRTGFCESAQRKCTERKPIGGACTPSFNNQECASGAWCSDSRMTCSAQVDNGVACTDGDECKSDNCVNDKCAPGLGALGLTFLCGAN